MIKFIFTFSVIFFSNKIYSQFYKIGEKYYLHSNYQTQDKYKVDIWTLSYSEINRLDTIYYFISSHNDTNDLFVPFYYPGEEKEDDYKRCYTVAEYNNLVKQNGKLNANKILSGLVWIGMTKKQALQSWGKASSIKTTITRSETSEQWIYDRGPSYIYFTNGKLTTIQQ